MMALITMLSRDCGEKNTRGKAKRLAPLARRQGHGGTAVTGVSVRQPLPRQQHHCAVGLDGITVREKDFAATPFSLIKLQMSGIVV